MRVKASAATFKKIGANFLKLGGKTAGTTRELIDVLLDLFNTLRKNSKNLKPLLDDILDYIRDMAGLVTRQVTDFFATFGLTLKKVKQPALYSGIPIPVGDDVYALSKNGKEIFRGTKKEIDNIADYLKTLNKADAERYLLELADIRLIDDVIKKLKIDITIPKNTLNAIQSIKKLENIFQSLKNKIPPKHYNPKKEALKKLGIKLKVTKNGLCADFAGTKYLYPAKGKEKNIIKIKLTGNDYYDFKLANDLAGLSKKPLGYTWHHLDDYDPITNTCTMQLVKIKYHRKTNPHFGSVELVKQFFNSKDLYVSRNKLKKIKL